MHGSVNITCSVADIVPLCNVHGAVNGQHCMQCSQGKGITSYVSEGKPLYPKEIQVKRLSNLDERFSEYEGLFQQQTKKWEKRPVWQLQDGEMFLYFSGCEL